MLEDVQSADGDVDEERMSSLVFGQRVTAGRVFLLA